MVSESQRREDWSKISFQKMATFAPVPISSLYNQHWVKLLNVFDAMTVHIMVTNWVVETKMASSKRLYCVVLNYLRLGSGQSPAPRPLFPGHQVTREADDEGG